jgi:hypothetical protein
MARSIQLLAVMLGTAALMCAADDPALGTWKLNVAKSKYLPGPAPKSQVRIYEQVPDGIKATVRTVTREDQTIVEEYPSNYDGREHTVTGAPDKDGIIMTKMDFFTAESKIIHGGNVIGFARRTVSGDGKTMTITFQGTVNGEMVNNVGFYERQ